MKREQGVGSSSERKSIRFGSLELPLRKMTADSLQLTGQREAQRRTQRRSREEQMSAAQAIITGAEVVAFLVYSGWNRKELSFKSGVVESNLSMIMLEKKPLRFARERIARIIKN